MLDQIEEGTHILNYICFLIKPRNEIISINDLYGWTQNNFRDIMTKQHNAKIAFFDFKDLNKYDLSRIANKS